MPKYIDAEKIRPYKGFFEKIDNVPKFYEWVETLPTADVVEVVRCKDCKHRHQTTCPFLIANAYKTSDDEDFCSRGEKREDGIQN